MSFIKYFKRFELMHWLIKTNNTGNPDEFASKMGLSRRQLLDNLKEFKSLGAPIKFSKIEDTYYYSRIWEPFGDLSLNN
jgi:hypothetical protein